ncbi:MAG: 2-octaprenyl-6-methoxyphenol hydroxylase [Pseudomonadota bacterium]|jgi:2-octaprenyl-6-methoxyphenol hydroxylase
MSSPRASHYDVVIVGAGMVGASLALALTRNQDIPLRLLLVEASALHAHIPAQQPGFDARSTVLSAVTVAYFTELGLWNAMADSAQAIKQIHVSDQGHFGTVRLDSDEEQVAALGHVIENAALGRALNDALFAAQGLELCAPVAVAALAPDIAGMRLTLESNEGKRDITAALVVLAEGGRSGLSAQLGIAHRREGYGQSAVIANVGFASAHRNVAYERFTPKGPLALLPLADREGSHRAALVWTHPESEAQAMLELSDAEFLARLQRDFGGRVGSFMRVGKRVLYPLALQVAEEQVRPGLVLLGNVAHTLHPVAGQGFNLALRDTMMLAYNIRESLRQQQDPGAFARLQQYRQSVQQDQYSTIAFSDYMTRLFSSNNRVLGLVRQFGMASIDLLPPLKHQFSRQAMGLAQPHVTLP